MRLTAAKRPVVGTEPDPAGARPFRFVDLFAGIGGFRLGLEAAGGTCVSSVEWDKYARQTYAANFGREPQGEDIRNVGSLPPHEILAAGFPCQPFSLAGVSKKVSLGRSHGFADETQGTLFFELQRLIDSARPPILILENVKNLLSHDQGRTFKVIEAVLDELNYATSVTVVDARYWVPQHRERTIIVGLERGVFDGRRFAIPTRPLDPTPRPKLAAILARKYDPKYVLSEHLWTYLRNYKLKHQLLGNGFGYGLANRSDHARTLSARYHKDGSEILIRRRPGQPPRRMTPGECARLMGFPRGFTIPVSDTQAYRQFGNAIVVPVARDIGLSLVRNGFVDVAMGLRKPSELINVAQEGARQLPLELG